MVTRKQVKGNMEKLIELHETALFTYHTNGVDKYLPFDDIDALIAKYKTMKPELQAKFLELL